MIRRAEDELDWDEGNEMALITPDRSRDGKAVVLIPVGSCINTSRTFDTHPLAADVSQRAKDTTER